MEDYTALIKTLRYLATEIPCPDCPLAEECPGIESCCFGHAALAIEELTAQRGLAYSRLCAWCGICEKPTPMRLESCEIAMIGKEYEEYREREHD